MERIDLDDNLLTIDLRDTEIRDETIVFEPGTTLHGLGPNLILENCTLDVKVGGGGIIYSGVTLRNCTFNQRVPLKNEQFDRVHWDSVRMTGHYSGCDFGNWDDPSKGSVRNCDFSAAVMDGIRFINIDPDSITLPLWPHFALVKPSAALDYVRSQSWPRRIGVALDIMADNDPRCSMVVDNAKRLAEKDGISIEEVRSLITNIPGLRIGE